MGARVCAEAGFACLEDNGWYAPRVPRMGLSEKLGYQEREVVYDTTGEIDTAHGPLRTAGEPRQIELGAAEVIGTNSDGSPAVVQSAFGKGRFVYFSSYPSLHQRAGYDAASAATLMTLCRSGPDCACRLGVAGDVPGTGVRIGQNPVRVQPRSRCRRGQDFPVIRLPRSDDAVQ